jgi:hypothetical protein
MNLHDFLFRVPHRFQWGGSGKPHPRDPNGYAYNDCTTFCASWAENLTGIDPARDLRGTYATAVRAHRIIANAGGIVPFYAAKLEPLGFERVHDKEDGDIAIIEAFVGMDGEVRQIGGIAFGPLWAALAPSGVAAKPAQQIASWRLSA